MICFREWLWLDTGLPRMTSATSKGLQTVRLILSPEVIAWMILTSGGALASILSLRQLVRLAAILPADPVPEVLAMTRHNIWAESWRLAAHIMFWLVGVRVLLGFSLEPATPHDQITTWAVVVAYGTLVFNSINEWLLARGIFGDHLRRIAEARSLIKRSVRRRAAAGAQTEHERIQPPADRPST